MKKGRHRRFEEARSLKRSLEGPKYLTGEERPKEACAECGAKPTEEHASWCLAESEDILDEEDSVN